MLLVVLLGSLLILNINDFGINNEKTSNISDGFTPKKDELMSVIKVINDQNIMKSTNFYNEYFRIKTNEEVFNKFSENIMKNNISNDYMWYNEVFYDKGEIVLKPIIETKLLDNFCKKYPTKKEFYKFLEDTQYVVSDEIFSTPKNLIDNKIGNCNDYTVLIGFWLSKYTGGEIEPEVIQVRIENNAWHIYLKVKITGQQYNIDYTRNKDELREVLDILK